MKYSSNAEKSIFFLNSFLMVSYARLLMPSDVAQIENSFNFHNI